MLFRQFVDDDLGCASYLIGDESSGEAVVVDPAYAIEQYAEPGVRIVRVLETHTHADHVSGHGRFALEHGVPVAVHPLAEPEFPFEPLADGQELRVGSVSLRVLHTPGHRPEHCCFAVEDLVLTGDSLFVGDAARPDLAVEAREGAEGLFHSLRRLTDLPDGVAVYPGHVAGSLCGAAMSSRPSSTIGEERRDNPALAYTDVQDFVNASASISAPRPPTLERVVGLNRGPFVGAPEPLGPVDLSDGLTVLDVRPPEEFAVGHVEGAINVPVSGSSFATRAGFVLDPDERIAIHASSPEEAEQAARGLRAVGFLELAGRLDAPATPATLTPVAVSELEALLASDSIQLVDVRELNERDTGYIAGSKHIPWRLLRVCGRGGLDEAKPVVTICESGARAAIAASILAADGLDARPVLNGGIPDWQGRTVEFRRCGS